MKKFINKTAEMKGGEYDFAEKVFVKDGAFYGAMHLYDSEFYTWKIRDLTKEEIEQYA